MTKPPGTAPNTGFSVPTCAYDNSGMRSEKPKIHGTGAVCHRVRVFTCGCLPASLGPWGPCPSTPLLFLLSILATPKYPTLALLTHVLLLFSVSLPFFLPLAFLSEVKSQDQKSDAPVSRDRYLFQKREVGHRMREVVAEVMGKGTQAMYHDDMNVHTQSSTQPWTDTYLSPFLLHMLIQMHMPYIMTIVQSFSMPLHHALYKTLSSCSLQLNIYHFSGKHSLVGTLKIQWVAFKIVSPLSLRSRWIIRNNTGMLACWLDWLPWGLWMFFTLFKGLRQAWLMGI